MHALRQRLAVVAWCLARGPTAVRAAVAVSRPNGRAALPRSAHVALVPLDDRPSSLQDPILLGAVADAEIATPPRIALGRFLKTGDGDAIARWLDGLDLATLDAAIVSTDMLAYGGLVGSRAGRVFEADARRRLDALGRLKQRRPDLPVYAFGSIPRLAPNDDGGNPGWRQKLTRWAEIAPAGDGDAALAAERAALESSLPAGMIDRYRAVRARNLAVNLALADMVTRGAVDVAVFGLDEPAPQGLHVAERAQIASAIEKAGAASAAIQPGVDDLATALLSRALLARFKYQPPVRIVYSSDAARDALLPFSDASVAAVARVKAALAGLTLSDRAAPGSIDLFVYASRHEKSPGAESFGAKIAKVVEAGGRAAVADIDTVEAGEGASAPLVEALRSTRAAPRLFGYSSSPTGGATIAMALSHAALLAMAVDRLAPGKPDVGRRVAEAQVRYLLHRYISDFLYQGVVRPQVTEDVLAPRAADPLRLDDKQKARVEAQLLEELRPLAEGLVGDFAGSPWRLPSADWRRTAAIQVRDITGFTVSLPWSRMVEADIAFVLEATAPEAVKRPPAPRVLR